MSVYPRMENIMFTIFVSNLELAIRAKITIYFNLAYDTVNIKFRAKGLS